MTLTLEQVANWIRTHYYGKKSHIATSNGTQHAYLPVKTGSTGKLDSSLLDPDGEVTQSVTIANATVYVPTDSTHTALINLDNTSNTTGASAGIGFAARTGAGGIPRAFLGIISSATGHSTEFALKIRTGASTYIDAWRVDGNNKTRFGGTVQVDGFVKYTLASKTIATGVITATTTYTAVDTQGGAASDDLDTINGGSTGDLIIIGIVSSSRSVTIKDGTGNISCVGDRVLNHVDDSWVGIFNGARWCELSYANNV